MKRDQLQYVRDYYKVPAYVGVKVEYEGKPGVITGGDGQYVKAKLEGETRAANYHPSDLKYIP